MFPLFRALTRVRVHAGSLSGSLARAALSHAHTHIANATLVTVTQYLSSSHCRTHAHLRRLNLHRGQAFVSWGATGDTSFMKRISTFVQQCFAIIQRGPVNM